MVCASAMLAGCADTAPALPTPPVPSRDAGSNVRAAEAGIEVLWWAVDDSQGAVGRALAPFVEQGNNTIAPAWRGNGLRLLVVPRDKLEVMAAGMPTVGPLQRQWFGMLGSWTAVISGRPWAGRNEILVDDHGKPERFSLGPGRLRLLARCWNEPVVNAAEGGAGAVLRVEVLPQHEEPSPIISAVDRSDQTRRGHTFESLGISFAAQPGMAYVIVPETPSAEWAPVEEASNDRPLGPPRVVEDQRGAALPPTLGEAMLTDAGVGGMARTRVIVVLVPRAPERFELIRSREVR